MIRYRHLFTALALIFSAVGSSYAGDIKIYGRIDTGIAYQHFSGDPSKSNHVGMENGTNTPSRWGIEGLEVIDDDFSVGFRLENRFSSDTGELKSGAIYGGSRMFEGNASVKLVSKRFGEIAAGRISGLSSSSGPYDLQYYMDPFGGGTFGTATQPVLSNRMDNLITYRSPSFAGLQVTFQHSLKMNGTETGDEATGDATRFWAGALHYTRGPLEAVAAFEGTTWGHSSQTGAVDDRKVATLGGSYRFDPATVYLQAQYFEGLEWLDGFTSVMNDESIKGYGLYAGTQFWYGLSSWQTMIYWRDYTVESQKNGDMDADSIGLGSKFVYRPSKTVDLYVGGSYFRYDRFSNLMRTKTNTVTGWSVYTGVTKYF